MAAEIIAIASDHAGVGFKESLKTMMSEAGRDVLDLEQTAQIQSITLILLMCSHLRSAMEVRKGAC